MYTLRQPSPSPWRAWQTGRCLSIGTLLPPPAALRRPPPRGRLCAMRLRKALPSRGGCPAGAGEVSVSRRLYQTPRSGAAGRRETNFVPSKHDTKKRPICQVRPGISHAYYAHCTMAADVLPFCHLIRHGCAVPPSPHRGRLLGSVLGNGFPLRGSCQPHG